MKKRFIVFLFAALILLSVIALSSCRKKDMLATPAELAVDENNLLTWSPVESARLYTLEIKTAAGETVPTDPSRLTSYSLSKLTVGDYEIRVMATGGADNKRVSEWSEVLYFHRDYESGCVFELINGNAEYRVKSGRSAGGEVLIEATYRGKPVTEIAENAFKGNRNIERVILGENIRSIGENAFYNCGQLTAVSIPDGVTFIGISAFQGCRSLTTVNIPKGITTVPEYCFAYCRALSAIEIGDQITEIAPSAFKATALSEVVIPNSVKTIAERAFSEITDLKSVTIGNGVLALGDEVFYGDTQLSSLTFAEGIQLTAIGLKCFYDNRQLASITLPESLTDIGAYCFYSCESLASIRIPENVTHIGTRAFHATKLYQDEENNFVYADNWLVAVKDVGEPVRVVASDFRADTVGISDGTFASAKNLISVTLCDSIETVGRAAFIGCELLNEFKAGKSLLRIQSQAFQSDVSLYILLLNNGLKEIDDYAFYNCSMLDNNALNPIIPKSVQRIGYGAFWETALWKKPDNDHIIYAGDWAVGYDETASLGSATLQSSVVGVSDYAFRKCTSLTTLGNLSRCVNIGEGAFYGCSALETVTLHPRMTVLPDYVFYKCSSLYRVNFPLTLKSIGRSAFYKCTTLRNLDLVETDEDGVETEITPYLESIGMYAFYGCTNLQQVSFNEGLSAIGDQAFSHCTALQGVKLPEKLTVIGDHVFAYCSAMKELTIGGSVTEIKPYAFYKCSALAAVKIPDSVTSIGENAFYKCTGITNLTFGNSLVSIGDYAFYNAGKLTSLSFPRSLQSIGKYAFKGAALPESIVLPANIREIGSNAFCGCKHATFYVEEGAGIDGWNLRWNSSNRPVVLNARLSEEKDYVIGITVRDGSVLNNKSLAENIAPTAPPARAGFTFSGWQKEDSSVLNTSEIASQPSGTVLTAIWTPVR